MQAKGLHRSPASRPKTTDFGQADCTRKSNAKHTYVVGKLRVQFGKK
jgi:hypothetical protein